MEIKPLPKTPNIPSQVGDGKGLIKSLWDHIIKSNQTVNALIDRANNNITVNDFTGFTGDCGYFGEKVTASIDYSGFFDADLGGF